MRKTLSGRTVMVTRPVQDTADLVGALEVRGAVALVAPAIRLAPAPSATLDRAARAFAAGGFQWAVFTSRAGVEALLRRVPGTGGRCPVRVAAVGEGTAAALRAFGVEPDLVPVSFTTEALGRAFPRGSGQVLLARADIAPDGLEAAIGAKGWSPVRVDAYRTTLVRSLPPGARRALARGEVDAVTFTSVSTVEGFLAAAGRSVPPNVRLPKAVCIGPVTAQAARAAGLRVAAVARPHTIEGLVAAVERALRRRRPRSARKER